MWPFSKKYSLITGDALRGFTDRHCHLLPGVDDGVQKMDETLAILADYEKWGFREVWLTPHIMEDIPNTTAKLRERYAELQEAYHGSIKLHLSAENMLDNLFVERLENDDLLPYGKDGKELLVETSYAQAPIGMMDMIDAIIKKGYKPVLAHPERYMYMGNDRYMKLKQMGIKFQMNVTSYVGAYGPVAAEKAHYLYQNGYYSYFGTDCHSHDAIVRNVNIKSMKETPNLIEVSF